MPASASGATKVLAPAPGKRLGVPVTAPGGPTLETSAAGDPSLRALTREWLLELKVMGRSPRTLDWYGQKLDWYLRTGQAATLSQLTAFELKRYLGELRDRGLADNTIHGFFEIMKALANWAAREGYPVDPAFLRVRAPQVAQKEVDTYSPEQLAAIFQATQAGWPTVAIQILLGTGMRLSELCALQLDDFEDDGEQAFLKIRRGKGVRISNPASSNPGRSAQCGRPDREHLVPGHTRPGVGRSLRRPCGALRGAMAVQNRLRWDRSHGLALGSLERLGAACAVVLRTHLGPRCGGPRQPLALVGRTCLCGLHDYSRGNSCPYAKSARKIAMPPGP